MSKIATKADFLSIGNIKKEIQIEELKKSVFIKVMNGTERRKFHALMAEDKDVDANGVQKSMVATIIALCAVDENFKNIFMLEDLALIDELPSTITDKIFQEAIKFNGLSGDSVEEGKKN